ncbi:MAG: hypothetical protein IAF38_02475 [Bacteroidia bacterium]|nr:hypothetical protein [Bacteroidia bacterium]
MRYKQFGLIDYVELEVHDDHLRVAKRHWLTSEHEEIQFREIIINRMEVHKKPDKAYLLLSIVAFTFFTRIVLWHILWYNGKDHWLNTEFVCVVSLLLYSLCRWIFVPKKIFHIPIKNEPFIELEYKFYNAVQINKFSCLLRNTAAAWLKQQYLFKDTHLRVETRRGRAELLKDLDIITREEYEMQMKRLNDTDSTHYNVS